MARPTVNPLFSPVALCRFFLVAAVGLTIDIWTKSLAVSQLSNVSDPTKLTRGFLGDVQLKPLGPHELLPPCQIVDYIHGWLNFEFVQNPGAVFGFMPGKRVMFLIVSVVATGFLTYLFSASGRKWFYQIILGMLMAGVLGNMYDRGSEVGQVRDMIHALPGWYWPASVQHTLKFLQPQVFPYVFNVADTLLCTGVGLMLIYSFFNPPEEAKEKKPRAKTAEAQ